MNWFVNLLSKGIRTSASGKKGVPEGLWSKCDACNTVLYGKDLDRNQGVCPKCEHHQGLYGRTRLDLFLDKEHRLEIGENIAPVDILKFRDSKKYRDRISASQKTTGEKDALIAMEGKLKGMPVVAVAFDYRFMGGSMGAVVGERFTQAAAIALEKRRPLICFSASGGARMQEGLSSLMQMAKTSAAIAKLSRQGIPYISILTHPTMGGVSASLAMLGDIIIAEPKALIGFAGPRVIEQTVREVLPEGFQRSEFLIEHGAIDAVIDRRQLRDTVARMLAKLCVAL